MTMRVHQCVYFAISSVTTSADDVTDIVGLSRDVLESLVDIGATVDVDEYG